MANMSSLSGSIPVGPQVLGRVLGVNGEPLDGGQSLSGASWVALDAGVPATETAPAPSTLLKTGIKVIDLFAPLPRNGTVAMVAEPGVGMLVVLSELIHIVTTQQGGCAVLVALEEQTVGSHELVRDFREYGVLAQTAILLGKRDASEADQARLALAGLTIAEAFRAEGRQVILAIETDAAPASTIDRLLEQGSAHSSGGITTIILSNPPEISQETLTRTYDERLSFNRTLAKEQIYPAIDPLASTSRLVEEGHVSQEHLQVAHQARQLLERAQRMAAGKEPADTQVLARARRIQVFQSQPFFVAEPYTARPAKYVPLAETVQSYQALLQGQYDALPEESFRFIGAIDEAKDQA
jgi:F-type H+/Na+-transporting ATPase subunit beta